MKKKKNILFLLTDQQRYDTLSCNGSYQCKTPYIDEVAIDKIDIDQWQKRIGIVSQDIALFNDSIFNNLEI